MANRIHAELVQLLRDHIQTYEQLEVLLLLGRDPRRDWGADAVAAGLRLPAVVAGEALEYLTSAGLLTRAVEPSVDGFRCHPDSARALSGLTRTFRDDRTRVLHFVSHNAEQRLWKSALRTFAAALRLRRKHDR